MKRRFWRTAIKHLDLHAGVSQWGADLIDQSRVNQCFVGYHERSTGVHALRDLTQLGDGAAAKQQFSGVMKRPGGSHCFNTYSVVRFKLE